VRRVGAALIGALVLVAVAPRVEAQEIREYRVRRGDTCGQIARRTYGNSRRYDLIHEHNPELGPMPHHLQPGTVLRLPVVDTDSDSDATVTATRREVRHQRPAQGEWSESRVGQDLNQGWRLSTGERSNAELTFQRSSVASIRESTLVIIYGTEARRVRRESNRAVVRRGSVLSRLGSLSGGGDQPLEVETPAALATLRQGESQVDVDEDGSTRVAVHGGQQATVTTPSGEGAVQVREGMGTSVQPGQRPRRPRPLPRAPRWESPVRRFVGLADAGGTIRGTWAAVNDAERYRVEVARREDGRDLVIQTVVPAEVTELEFHRLPPGTYYVRVATIDTERFEGRPSRPVELSVVEATLVAPGAPPPDAAAEAEPDPLAGLERLDDGLGDLDHQTDPIRPPRVPQYATLQLPGEVRCAFGEANPVGTLRLVDLGSRTFRCAEGEQVVGGLSLDVVATRARVLDADGRALASLPREATAVRLSLDPPLDDVSGLTVLAPPGVTVREVAPHPGGGLGAEVAAGGADAEQVVLQVATADESHLPIAEAQVAVDAAPPPQAPDAPPPPPAVDPDPQGVQEAYGLAAFASSVGLRDERRSGSGMHLAMSVVSAAEGDPRSQLRVTGGARAALFDDYLRLDVAVPLDLRSASNRTANRASRDVYFAAGSRVLDEDPVGLAVEVGMWAPTASDEGLDRGRLMLGADFSLRLLDDLFTIRTRQAGIFDLVEDGSLLWASAYGLDVAVAGPLSAGVELDLVIGREDGRDWVAAAAGAGLALDFGAVAMSLAGRIGFGDDAILGFGGGTLAVRGHFR